MLATQFASLEIPRLIVTHDDLDISSLCTREIVVRRKSNSSAIAN
jgi:hypothetical protein